MARFAKPLDLLVGVETRLFGRLGACVRRRAQRYCHEACVDEERARAAQKHWRLGIRTPSASMVYGGLQFDLRGGGRVLPTAREEGNATLSVVASGGTVAVSLRPS